MPEEKTEVKEEKKARVKKGKKKRKPKKSSEKWKKYKMQGNKVERSSKFCPRCGPGIFLAEMKDRFYCGRCRYTEFKQTK